MRTRTLVLLALTVGACSSSETLRSEFDDEASSDTGGGDTGATRPFVPTTPTPASGCRGIALPEEQHFVPDGLCASAVAIDIGTLRQITFAKNGDLFGATSDGLILRFRDLDSDGFYRSEEITRWASVGGTREGNNVAIDEERGFLYAGGPGIVRRFPYSPAADSGGDGEDIIVELPSTGSHVTHTVKLHDGFLYVHAGSENNWVAPTLPGYDNQRAVIKRFPIDATFPLRWTDGDVYARGLRNTVGYTFDPAGSIYAVDNGIDNLVYEGKDIHEQNPADSVFVVERGRTFGYPYCFGAFELVRADGTRVVPGTMLPVERAENAALPGVAAPPPFTNPHDEAWCADNAVPAVNLLPAHSAALDIALVERTNAKLPAPFDEGAFIALHGSWNRDRPTGFKVVHVKFTEVGSTGFDVVFGGGRPGAPEDGPWGWLERPDSGIGESLVRPVGVAISPIDGSLFVSSDNAPVIGQRSAGVGKGALYRIAPEATFITPD